MIQINNNKHISSSRKNEAQALITAKISIIEKYLTDGVPDGAFVPKNKTQFRLWEDSLLNLKKIGSPNTLEKPYNKPYKERIERLLHELATRQNRKERKTQIVETLRAEIKEKNQLISDLAGQWHSIKQQLERSENNEKRLQARVAELNLESANLTRQLKVVTPLKIVNSGNI